MSTIIAQENLKKFSDIEACPIRNIVSRFSGKWSMLILCILAENQAIRFNTIGKAIPDISPKMLTETLKNLETDGLVKRKVYAEVPPRVEYSLTDLVSCPISEASYAGLLKTSKPFPKTENPNHANNPRNYIVLTQQKVTDNHFWRLNSLIHFISACFAII